MTQPPEKRRAREEAGEPLDTSRPFTRASALRGGIGKQLRTLAYRQLIHGVYVDAAVPDTPLLWARAALVPFGPKAWASHATAARVLGLPVPPLPGEHVTVLDRKERRDRAGVTCHHTNDGLIIKVDGTRVSAPAQLFVELASLLTLVDLVVVGDHLVRKEVVTLADLRDFCTKAAGPGAAQARAAVTFVRERVDSPMETRLRMLIVLAGLPEPEINPVMDLPGGRRRYDLCWREARLVVEYDGRHHIERQEQWESDLDRREEIEDDGWRLLIVTARGIYRSPDETLAKIHRLLIQRGEPGVPRRLKDTWRAHFPVRGDYLNPTG